MKQKRIVLAAGLYPPDIGGPATYAAMVAATLPRHGITVTVVPFHTVRRVPKLFRHVVYTVQLLRASGGADAVYALDPVSVGLPALVVSCIRRQPLLVRLGGDYAWEQGRQRFGVTETLDTYTEHRFSAAWQVRFLHRVQALVARQAAQVIVPSHYLKRTVATWGIDPERLRVIYSAVSPLPVSKSREDARVLLGVGGFVVTSVSRLTPWKGEQALITVLASLRAQGIDATLLIAGDGPYRKMLEQHAKAMGVEAHVRFLGVLDRGSLGNLFAAADVYVLNSAYEGLSHQLLEAMAARIPIIASNVGGNAELITHDETGLLVAYNDKAALEAALHSVYQNPAAANARVVRAEEKVSSYTEAASETALHAILSSL